MCNTSKLITPAVFWLHRFVGGGDRGKYQDQLCAIGKCTRKLYVYMRRVVRILCVIRGENVPENCRYQTCQKNCQRQILIKVPWHFQSLAVITFLSASSLYMLPPGWFSGWFSCISMEWYSASPLTGVFNRAIVVEQNIAKLLLIKIYSLNFFFFMNKNCQIQNFISHLSGGWVG